MTGCGSADQDKDATAKSAAIAKDGAMPSDWNAADACSILDKAAVAKILKTELSDTQLGMVSEPDAVNAATSECRYAEASGSSAATLMTRWSPLKDNTPESIAATRSALAAALKAMSNKQVEDVPGLGKAAFFVPGIDQLQVFLDDARMIIVTASYVPAGSSGKDIAIALARKAGA
jgi:hypothetical protein